MQSSEQPRLLWTGIRGASTPEKCSQKPGSGSGKASSWNKSRGCVSPVAQVRSRRRDSLFTLLDPSEQGRECHLALALDSYIGLQVRKRRLRKDAVAGSAQDYGCIGVAATGSHQFA